MKPDKTTIGDTGVVVRSAEGFAQEIVAEGHSLVSDEPTEAGGSGLGPSPYGLLLAALGSCTSMTMRMYAQRKGWTVDRIEVRLSHGRIYAEDCADCEKTKGRVDEIQRVISIEGPLDDAQRARLMEIADKCPVHRTLTNEIKIRTTAE